MARDFEVTVKIFPDNKTDADLATDIEAWLDGLNVGSNHEVYQLTTSYTKGFFRVIVIVEA